MGIRLFHASDVHLGAEPDAALPWGKERSKEIWESFKRLIQLAAKERPDLLLLTGDLFHRPPLLKELRDVNYLFSGIPETVVCIIAGNHDPLDKTSHYQAFPWEKNVIFLRGNRSGLNGIEAVRLEKLGVTLYGTSYTRAIEPENLYADARPNQTSGMHVLLVHGGDAQHSPFDAAKLAGEGFDYIACGHIHKPSLLVAGRAAYAGSLEPQNRTEEGQHGFLDVTLEEGMPAGIQFRALAARSYVTLPVTVGEREAELSLSDRISQLIREKGDQNLYKILLQGKTEFPPDKEPLYRLGNIYSVEDQTGRSYDYEELEKRYRGTLLGAYIARLKGRPGAQRALEIGLDAFFGEEIS